MAPRKKSPAARPRATRRALVHYDANNLGHPKAAARMLALRQGGQ